MISTSICIYTNDDSHTLLYNNKTDAIYMNDIARIINSTKWKEMKNTTLHISYNTTTQFICQTTAKRVYIVICDNSTSPKIYNLIDSIKLFVESQPTSNLSSYKEKFDEIIRSFTEQEKHVGKNQNPFITDTMNDTIVVTIDKQNTIDDMHQNLIDSMTDGEKIECGNVILKREVKNKWLKTILLMITAVMLFGVIEIIYLGFR